MSNDNADVITKRGSHTANVFQHRLSLFVEHVFSAATETIWVLKRQPKQSLERATIDNSSDMQLEAEANSARKQHSFYIISQKNTWSRLNVSIESFDHVVNAHNFSDNVYDVVQAFRHRTSDTDQFRWSACRVRLERSGAEDYELCYRLQYPIRNYRDRGDPFSMRQIGVCQKYCGPSDSTWIILQPSPELSSNLESTIDQPEYFSVQEADPMSLHLMFLKYHSVNWDDYVEHLRMEIEPLIEAAHFSRVGRTCKYPDSDYAVRFEECQKLQRIQWRLAQIVPAIDGNIAVLKTCKDCWLESRGHLHVRASVTDVRSLIKMLDFHKESMRKLGDQAQRSAELLHKILDFRSSVYMESTNLSMSQTLALLGEQARALTTLGEQREKDSKSLKALTSVATLYLPATLVATIFSSNLVSLSPSKPLHFVPPPQPWLPIAAVLLLMAVTLISIRLLERAYTYIR